MRNAKRFCAFVLALVMILPLISIPTFAQDTLTYVNQGKLLWSNDFENANALSDVYASTGSLAQLKDIGGEHGKVYYSDNKPDESSDKYYLNYDKDDGSASNDNWAEIKDVVVDETAGTISGTVTFKGTTYTLTKAPINTDSRTSAADTYLSNNGTAYATAEKPATVTTYVCTALVREATQGGNNTAEPNWVKLTDKKIAPSTTDVSLVFVADYYFSTDYASGMDVRLNTQAGNIEFANLVASGNNIAVKLHDNLKGKTTDEKEYSVTFAKGTWATIAVAVNISTGMVHLYCNGDLAGYGTMASGTFTSITGGNGWNLGHVRRGSAVSAYKGHWMVDNLAIYSGDYGAWADDTLYSRSFDMATAPINYGNGTYSINTSYGGDDIGGHVYMNWTQGKANASLNYPNGGIVDQNLRFTDFPEISYTNYDSVVFEADYYLPEDANYHFQLQFLYMNADWYGADETMAESSYLGTCKPQWNQITQVKVTGGKITEVSAGNKYDSNATVKTYDYNIPTGQWVTISTVLDLDSGWIELWMNGSKVVEWQMNFSQVKLNQTDAKDWDGDGDKTDTISYGGYAKNITIPSGLNGWIVTKLSNKITDSEFANGYSGDMLIDNLSIYEGETPRKYVETFEPIKFNSDDFESYEVGHVIDKYDSYNANYPTELAPFTKVLADEDGNKFVRFPMVYNGEQGISVAGHTNMDKDLIVNHTAITPDQEFMVFDLSFRPHGGEAASTNTVELQLRSFNFDMKLSDGGTMKPRNGEATAITEDVLGKRGIYCQLLVIDINTGDLRVNNHSLSKKNDMDLVMDEWNNITYILDLKNATAVINVNGKVFGTVDSMIMTGSDWSSCTNCSNISIPAGNIIVAKMNKTDGAYMTTQEADENYSNVNYMDIDNISVTTKTAADFASDFDPSAYEGIVTAVNKASVRMNAPAGLRFATQVNEAMLDELYDEVGKSLKNMEFGTLIVPEDYLEDGTPFTEEALKEAGKLYLNVKATYGKYYNAGIDNDPSTTHFVGSIVNIFEKNIVRPFAGIGYVKVTLMSGQDYYFYAEKAHVANVQGTAKTVIDTTDLSGYTVAAKKTLNAFKDGKGLSDIIAQDLDGLNVLAMGDSLFAGTDKGTAGCARENQWVNLIGRTNNWTLTNLGIGGMTVSQTEANVTTGKASMYEWLFNDINDYNWNSSSTTKNEYNGTAHNTYFQCGDFTGKTAEDVDLIILEGGCNDYGYAIAAPLGTITSKDPSTFLGAWNCVVEELLRVYPNAKIIFITTWYLNPQSRPDNLTSIEYSTSINRLYDEVYADNDRVYLIDAGNPAVSGVDMLNLTWRNEYSNDGYHLKDNGMAVMAENMLPRIWEIWVNATANESEEVAS